jgi:hypothetical protein
MLYYSLDYLSFWNFSIIPNLSKEIFQKLKLLPSSQNVGDTQISPAEEAILNQ